MNLVRIAKLGEPIKELRLESTTTIWDALRFAGFQTEGVEVRRRGAPVDLQSEVEANDTLTLIPKIKGGEQEG